MSHDPQSAWLIAACDLPSIHPKAIAWLRGQRGPDQLAVLPRQGAGGVEPLFAIYEPASAPLLREIAQEERPAPRQLARLSGVACPEIPTDLQHGWTNLTTPDAWESFISKHTAQARP